MTLAQMKLLKLLVENGGNISHAAEKLHIAQSALSRRLQQLEAELYQQLFHRNGKRLGGLTKFGVEILEQVNQMLISETNIINLAADYRANDRGTLSIATTHAQARYFLPNPLLKFTRQYPNVRMLFQQDRPSHLLDMLYSGEADFVICTEQLTQDPRIDSTPLYQWNHILALPANHPLHQGKITLERLTEYPLLTYLEGITGRTILQQSFHEAGVALNPLFSASDSDVLIEYVKSGFGVGVLCGMARAEIEERGLTTISMRGRLPQFQTKTGWMRNRRLRTFEKILLKELISYANQLDWRE